MSQDNARFRCTTDAVHPRFQPLRALYCKQCSEHFAVAKLKEHFTDKTISHTPLADKCAYCQGNVYEYKHGEETKTYHRCQDASNVVDMSASSTPSLISVASNSSETSSTSGYGSMSS